MASLHYLAKSTLSAKLYTSRFPQHESAYQGLIYNVYNQNYDLSSTLMSPLVLRSDVEILFGSFPSVSIAEYIAVYI